MIESRHRLHVLLSCAVVAVILCAVTQAVAIVPPISIASISDITECESIEPLKADHGWQVRLALGKHEALPSLKLLYCRAEWTDQNSPPCPIPFERYHARHLGPVIWTLSANRFREGPPALNSRPAPPVSLQGESCIYAATLPLSGFKEGYVQVYSAFTGRELARQRISPPDSSSWPWGLLASREKDKPFRVCTDFEAASPGMPAFRPVRYLSAESKQKENASIKLSLKDGLFTLKADTRILPIHGIRLLARWWLNDRAVLPHAAPEPRSFENSGTEPLAGLLRLPASIPASGLKAKPGDKIGLQVMLCPDRIESPSCNNLNMQNIVCLDAGDLPSIPVLSNRMNFRADSKMFVQPDPNAVTAATFKRLTDAIVKEGAKEVKSLVAANPQLVTFRGGSNRTALHFLCRTRPKPRYLWRWRLGGDITSQYWKQMAEIAGILIDYGADVNAQSNRRTTLQALLDSEESFGRTENALPVELVTLLLDRGADLEAVKSTEGTVLQQVLSAIQFAGAKRMTPIAKILLDRGANVFGMHEPWQRSSAFDQIDELKKRGHPELAALIGKHADDGRNELKHAVHLGVEQFFARIRNADENALLALRNELPAVEGIDWLRWGRSFQRDYGASLESFGSIEQLYIKGNWADVLVPTGRRDERAKLRFILMRYPGDAYHIAGVSLLDPRKATRSIANDEGLTNAVYSAFDRSDMCKISDRRSTGYPRRFDLLSIKNDQGSLVVRGLNMPSSVHFHAEIAPDVVRFWDDIWQLHIARKMTFAKDDKQLIMADGLMTAQIGEKKVVFNVSEGQVRMQTNDTKLLASGFTLDLGTLNVKGHGDSTH